MSDVPEDLGFVLFKEAWEAGDTIRRRDLLGSFLLDNVSSKERAQRVCNETLGFLFKAEENNVDRFIAVIAIAGSLAVDLSEHINEEADLDVSDEVLTSLFAHQLAQVRANRPPRIVRGKVVGA